MEPLVSVIIPCYNTAEYLPQCLNSLEEQTIGFDRLQVILVDDASTDDGRTWECICGFEQKHPREVVAVHLENNCCQGGARNAGLEYATAAYVGFIDSDDWVEPLMYERLYECILKYRCDAADCRIIMDTSDGYQLIKHRVEDKFDCYEKNTVQGGTHWWTEFYDERYGGGIVTGIYRLDIIRDHGVYFPEHLKYEDNYWEAIFLLYVKSYYHMADDFYHYRQRSDSTVHSRNDMHHFDQLIIEEKKIQKFKELGLYERFYTQIEYDFLAAYYCRTLKAIIQKFDKPPYEVFCKMTERVRYLFPEYKKNTAFQKNEVHKILLSLIDKKISEKQFEEIVALVKELYGAEN